MRDKRKIIPLKIEEKGTPLIFDRATANIHGQKDTDYFITGVFKRNIMILFRGAGSDSFAKVKKGTGELASQNDMIIPLGSGDSAVVLLESGRFMQMDGEHKGSILLELGDDVYVTLITFD